MFSLIAEFLLFIGVVVFGLFLPQPFLFLILLMAILVVELNIKEQNAIKRHKELMSVQKSIAQSMNYMAKRQMMQRKRSTTEE